MEIKRNTEEKEIKNDKKQAFEYELTYNKKHDVYVLILKKIIPGFDNCDDDESFGEIQKELSRKYILLREYDLIEQNVEIVKNPIVSNLRKLKLVNPQRIRGESFKYGNLQKLRIMNDESVTTIIEKDAFYSCRNLRRIHANNVILESDSFKAVFPESTTITTNMFNMRAFYNTLQAPEDNRDIILNVTVRNILNTNIPYYNIDYTFTIPLEGQSFILEHNGRQLLFSNINNITVDQLYDAFKELSPLFTIHKDSFNLMSAVQKLKVRSAQDEDNKFEKIETNMSRMYNLNLFNRVSTYDEDSQFIAKRIWGRIHKQKHSFIGNQILLVIEKTDVITIHMERTFERVFD